MGTGFFGKVAQADPLAQALNLPGSHKLSQQQNRDSINEASMSANLPFAGKPATLAGANAGYMQAAKQQIPGQQPPVNGMGGGVQRQWGTTSPYQSV